jgi:mono/diheme cytochrome c family protein
VKLAITSVFGLLAASTVAFSLPLHAYAQGTGRKNPDLMISSTAGRDLFEFYCASCHGRDGKGGGHVASALKVPPPDLTTLAQRNHGTFPAARVEAIIKGDQRLPPTAHGASDMPVWGPIFRGLDRREAVNAARIENIVKYLESLQAKSKAEPVASLR